MRGSSSHNKKTKLWTALCIFFVDLKQLIDLSKQNLLELKKKELLEQVEEVERNQVGVLASHQDQKNEDAQNVSDCVEVVDDMVSSLVGNKCLAPFRTNNQDQSHHTFHNAIIFSGQCYAILLSSSLLN